MEFLLSTVPNTLIGWFGLMAATGFLVVQLVYMLRRSDLNALRESNADLRAMLDDKTKQIDDLRKELNRISEKVAHIEGENKTLEELVIVALESYFNNNPEMANRQIDRVKLSRSRRRK